MPVNLFQPLFRCSTVFDDVLVMTESELVRNNRLSLLKKIVELWQPIADLSQIVIEEESR